MTPSKEAQKLARAYAEAGLHENELLVLNRCDHKAFEELFPNVIQKFKHFLAGFEAGKNAHVELTEELVKALEFYADEREYVNIGIRRDLYEDLGKRAREALKKFWGGTP